jgi:hypothetical protein
MCMCMRHPNQKVAPVPLSHDVELEDFRMPSDFGYGVCICGGQGDCLGCKEQEEKATMKSC